MLKINKSQAMQKIRWLRWPFLILGLLFICYVGIGFWLIPYWLEHKLPELFQTYSPRKLSIEAAAFNPFSGELKLSQVKISELDDKPFFSSAELFADLAVQDSLQQRQLIFSQIQATSPEILLTKIAAGKFNFSDLLGSNQPASESLPYSISELSLQDGKLSWTDAHYAKPVTLQLSKLSLKLANLSSQVDSKATFSLHAQINRQAQLDWLGQLQLEPFLSNGQLELNSLAVADLWQLLLQDQVKFQFIEGEKSIQFSYKLAYQKQKLDFQMQQGQLTVKNLQLAEKNKTATQKNSAAVVLPDFSLHGIQFDLQKQQLDIADLNMQAPLFKMKVGAGGRLNLQDLFAAEAQTSATKAEKETPWTVNVTQINVTNLTTQLHDDSQQLAVLPGFSGLDLNIKNYRLFYNEEKLQIDLPEASVKLQGLKLDFPQSNKQSQPRLQLDSMLAQLQGTQLVADKELQFYVSKAHLQAKNLLLLSPTESAPLIKLPDFELHELSFDLAKQQLHIDQFNANDGVINASLETDGKLNYQALFMPDSTVKTDAIAPQNPSVSASNTWTVALQQLALHNYSLNFTDKHLKPVLTTSLEQVELQLQQLTNQTSASIPLQLSANLNQTGSLSVNGNLVLEPFSSQLKLQSKNLALKHFQSYLHPFAKLNILNGNLNTELELTMATKPDTDLDLKLSGDTSISNFHSRDQALNLDFAKWELLSLQKLSFDLQAHKFRAKQIELQKPYLRLTIKKDRSLNVHDIFVSANVAETVKKKVAELAKDEKGGYRLGQISIKQGESDFSDLSLILPFSVRLTGLDGMIKRVASQQKKPTQIDLAGKVFDMSPVTIAGQFEPKLNNLNIALKFKSMPLPFISPYIVEFAGYKIEKGTLTLNLDYQVKDRHLTAENDLFIDQLTLGEKVDSPRAVSLPLELAVALMKDSSGRITLNVPLTGSLDDPKFDLFPLLVNAFTNTLMKTITSPFTVLGSLFNGKEDLSVVGFNAGQDGLTATEMQKLDQLAAALEKRPDLELEIKAIAYTEQDWPKMQPQALLEQLENIKHTNLQDEGGGVRENVELSDTEYKELLADLFIAQFPQLGERSLFRVPKLIEPAQGDFYAVAEQKLAAIIPPNPQKLAELAASRGRNIAKYLIQQKNIPNKRIFILEASVAQNSKEEAINAQLLLKAK